MRRTAGPKRRAEAYARRVMPDPHPEREPTNMFMPLASFHKLLAAAYLKGYASCARQRRARPSVVVLVDDSQDSEV